MAGFATFGLQLSLQLACDILITVSLTAVLHKHRSNSMLSTTKKMLDSLSRNTIENGLIANIFVILTMVFYFSRQNDLIYIPL
ncbi:hypothetical protein FA15DRAFT_595276 [Coprinopsis marcescibilis]|uniref:DUF6534 domain-containing protein n=1 Tax=Coprinopsis marcescibilis TaxID=230819 RepID=A0A5C3KR10_COPMA|nr:hypothetical protein FA15DRAFT_595276 [Coprinopsis marcescibilis]